MEREFQEERESLKRIRQDLKDRSQQTSAESQARMLELYAVLEQVKADREGARQGKEQVSLESAVEQVDSTGGGHLYRDRR